MKALPTYDAVIVGGGPAGSTCAAVLVKAGLRTLLLDRATFPRVKLCAGWLSTPVWDIIGLSPNAYTPPLWYFNNIHVRFHGRKYTLKSSGYFVRRYEFDEFLLRRSKVETREGFNVSQIEKDDENFWVIDNLLRTKYLIGAGGSHCPVARSFFPKPLNQPCGTQEREFEGDPTEIAACRAGGDGEPEIWLHDDMKGYSWNVPKGSWLNVGTGTKMAREVLPAWGKARAFFEGNEKGGTIPPASRPMLDKMKGHGYIGFDPCHLQVCQADNVFLVGDALGLAQPMTGEGILPAVLSGHLCATAIAAGVPESYAEKLRTHPIISDYRILHALQTRMRKIVKDGGQGQSKPGWLDHLIVNIFGLLFSGRRLPGSRIIAKMRR